MIWLLLFLSCGTREADWLRACGTMCSPVGVKEFSIALGNGWDVDRPNCVCNPPKVP